MHETPCVFCLTPNIGSVTTFRLGLYIFQMWIFFADNWYSLFTRPLKADTFYIFSSFFIVERRSYVISYTGIYSAKIDIGLYTIFFEFRSKIIANEECKVFRSPFTTGEHLIGAWFVLWINSGNCNSLFLVSPNELREIQSISFQIAVEHSKACSIFSIISFCR